MLKLGRTLVVFVCTLFLVVIPCYAQQTLGSINGTVTDTSGAVLQNAMVKIRSVATNNEGFYQVVDLAIGTYEVTFSRDGFGTEVHSKILIQGDRTTTVSASLRPGQVSATVTVTGTPLLNQTDMTNGYTLDSQIIENIPLGTGSFTQLAILAPGANADFLGGAGTNAGLGNQNIFANGQRDTSNTFTFNSVDANNHFNGLSSSAVGESRFVLNTNEHFGAGGQV